MAGRWFRFYAAAIRHPKVAKLTDKEFRLWCELLAVAAENDGAIPPLGDLKQVLKRRLDHLSTGVERLISIGLIDRLECGYEPHSWNERQYKSDTSTERVRKHRRCGNVSETPPDTETDTETESPLAPLEGGKADYAFFGKVIRLKPRDLDQWRRVYHAIPDIEAELTSIDAWMFSLPPEKRKDWFHRTSGSLNRKHQEYLAAVQKPQSAAGEIW